MQNSPQSTRKDFFISYNRADRHWAEWVAWQLEMAGYSTILQAWDFRPGTNFVLEMDEAAREGERTIAILSPDYLGAPNPRAEWAAAFNRDPTGKSRILLPVRVRECDLKGLLAQIVYIDLVGLDETAALKALLAGVQSGRARPTTAPRFPGETSGRKGTILRGETLSLFSGKPPFPKNLPLTTKAIEVFFSYAREDDELRIKLEKHLALLKRQGLITDWHVGEIGAGKEPKREIDTYLNRSRIILLLISPDFMASDECYYVVTRAMERQESENARVIPVILRPVDWHSAAFGKLLPLPAGGRPVTVWQDRDEAFLDVAKGIRKAVEEMLPVPEPEEKPDGSVPIPLPQMISQVDALFAAKDWLEVITEADSLIKLFPGAIPFTVYYMQGVAFFREGQTQQAHEALQTALTLVKDREQRLTVLRDYAAVLNSQRRWTELLSIAEEALQLAPGNSDWWLTVQQHALAKMSPAETGRVGQQIGSYRIKSILDKNSTGEIYLSEDIYHRNVVAIKVLNSSLSLYERAQFLSEASFIAKLVHPHIVRTIDFGVERDAPYLITDYLPNGSLRQRHAKGETLPLGTIKIYIKQIAAALQYAHNQRIPHCNLKPENMLLGLHLEILLSDFRIAAVTQHLQGRDNSVYTAPEQLAGRPCLASDQYALGIVLYEWLTGEQPSSEDLNFLEMSRQLSSIFPSPLRQRFPKISLALEGALVRALDKDPDRRFKRIENFADAIEQAS